ncbi:MAG: SPOR domain-containing protein [Magnetococcales bacterium]|nr:SPOR domain-containing protein [Magnetococcales bacterium]
MAPRYPTSPHYRRHRPQGQLSPAAAGVVGVLAVGGVLYSLSSDGRSAERIQGGSAQVTAAEMDAPAVVAPSVVGLPKDAKGQGVPGKKGVVTLPLAGGGHGLLPGNSPGQGNVLPHTALNTSGNSTNSAAFPTQATGPFGSVKEFIKGAIQASRERGEAHAAKESARKSHEKESEVEDDVDQPEAQPPEDKLVLTFYSDLKKQTVVLPNFPEGAPSPRFPHTPAAPFGTPHSVLGSPPAQAVAYIQASRSTPWQQPLGSLAKSGAQQSVVTRAGQGSSISWSNSEIPTMHVAQASVGPVDDAPRVAEVRPGSVPATGALRTPAATPIPVVAGVAGSPPRVGNPSSPERSMVSGQPSKHARAARMDDGSFMVPLGDYPDFTRAARMTNRLQAKGVPAQVVRLTGNVDSMFRVGIGPFPSEGDAERAAQQWQHSL